MNNNIGIILMVVSCLQIVGRDLIENGKTKKDVTLPH